MAMNLQSGNGNFDDEVAWAWDQEAAARSRGEMEYKAMETEMAQEKMSRSKEIHTQLGDKYPSPEEYDYAAAEEAGVKFDPESPPTALPNKFLRPGTKIVAGYDVASGDKVMTNVTDNQTNLRDRIAKMANAQVETNPFDVDPSTIPRVAAGAAFQVVEGTRAILDEMGAFGDEGGRGPLEMPDAIKPETEAEAIAQGLLAFAAPYGTFTKTAGTIRLFKTGNYGKAFVADTVASGLATQMVSDPAAGNLFTMLNEMGVDSPLVDFMDSKLGSEEEGQAWGRFQLAMEDAGLSALIPALAECSRP